MNRKSKKTPKQPRQPRTPRVDPTVGALHAIATAIERHAQSIESVRDAILEATGKMPMPEFVGSMEAAQAEEEVGTVTPESEEPVPAPTEETQPQPAESQS